MTCWNDIQWLWALNKTMPKNLIRVEKRFKVSNLVFLIFEVWRICFSLVLLHHKPGQLTLEPGSQVKCQIDGLYFSVVGFQEQYLETVRIRFGQLGIDSGFYKPGYSGKNLRPSYSIQPLIYSFRVKGFTMSFSSWKWGTTPKWAKISMCIALSHQSQHICKKLRKMCFNIVCQEASHVMQSHEPIEMFNQSRKCLVWILIRAH